MQSSWHREECGVRAGCSPVSGAGISERVRGAGSLPWKSHLASEPALPAGPQPSQLSGPRPRAPTGHCHPACASMGPFRGFAEAPLEGTSPILGALGRSLRLCGWGLWLWQKQTAARAALLKTGLLTEGTEMPHTSRDSRVLCPPRAPAPAGAPRLPRGPHLRAEQQGLPYIH